MCVHVTRVNHKPISRELEKMLSIESHLRTQLLCRLYPCPPGIQLHKILADESSDQWWLLLLCSIHRCEEICDLPLRERENRCVWTLQVPLKQVPDAKSSGLPRNAHALHILAHIELNAVDLAWDTVVRFSGASKALGQQFFADFAHVADDESRHFGWCLQRLSELGFQWVSINQILWIGFLFIWIFNASLISVMETCQLMICL